MAIEVIKAPTKRINRKMRGTCVDCGAKVRCDLSDTNEIFDRDTTEGSATRYIKCPCCTNRYLWLR